MNFYKTILFSLLVASFSLTTACGSNPTSSAGTAVAIGSPCSATTTCVDGAVCSTTASGGTECQKKCTQATESQDCTGGQKCTSVSDIQGANVSVCLVHGGGGRQGERAATDQACNPNATQPCQGTNDLCVPPANDPSGQTKCRTKCPHGTCANSMTHECKTTSDQKKVCEEKKGGGGGNGACDVVTALKTSDSKTLLFDTKTTEPAPTFSQNGDIHQVEFISGKPTFLNPQESAFRYIDFDTNSAVDISDVDAFKSNKDWDIGLRAFDFFTNGGQFPGDLKVTSIDGDNATGTKFKAFTKSEAAALTTGFLTEQVKEEKGGNCVPINLAGFAGIGPALTNMATSRLFPSPANSDNYWFIYDFADNSHKPHIRPTQFYLLKKESDPSWIVKLKLVNITLNGDGKLVYTVQYHKFN